MANEEKTSESEKGDDDFSMDDLADTISKGANEEQRIKMELWSTDLVHVVGLNRPHVLTISTGAQQELKSLHEVHAEKMVEWIDENGKAKSIPFTHLWAKSNKRQKVLGYTFNPAHPKGILPPKEGDEHGFFNLYPGMPKLPAPEKIGQHESKVMWRMNTLVKRLFGDYWWWVCLRDAHMLFKPGEPTTQAVMVTTKVQGIGKSGYGEIVWELVGEMGIEVKPDRLGERFNSLLGKKLFVIVNELDNKFSTKESQLNDLITQKEVTLEAKFGNAYTVPCYLRWYFTTNSSSPCRLSRGQRRILVLQPGVTEKQAKGNYGRWVRERVMPMKRSERDLGIILEWFKGLWFRGEDWRGDVVPGLIRDGKPPCEWWDPTVNVPETEAAREIYDAGATGTARVALRFLEDLAWAPEEQKEGETEEDCAKRQAREMAGKERGVVGWCLVGPDQLKGPHAKAWGEVLSELRAQGGKVSVLRRGGVNYKVLDTTGLVPFRVRRRPDGTVNWSECTMKLTSEEVDKLVKESNKMMGNALLFGEDK